MNKKKIVFLTGAGISAESGIETFRSGENSLWKNHDVKEIATPEGWKKDRQKVLDFYNARRRDLDTVEPNDAHKLIAGLEKDFHVSVVTQNIDDLHERGGSSDVIHLHGELKKMCSSMNVRKTLPYDRDILLGDKHEDGSQLRPFVVWFGEDVPRLQEAIVEVRSADALVIVGTSLEVYPAAGLMKYAKASCDLYYIDKAPKHTPVLKYFKTFKDPATEGMKKLVELLRNENKNKDENN